MNFVFLMAYREIRSSWHRLLFFFLCIAIGVASIVSLRSIVQNIRSSVSIQAQALLAADVQITSSTPLDQKSRALIDAHRKADEIIQSSESIELATMVRPLRNESSAPKQIEVRAVQPPFPLYGEVVLSNGQAYDFKLLQDRGLLVKPALLQQLDLVVGDKVRIGTLDFTIRGTVESEPGNTLNGFSLGPRVFASYDDLIAAGLTGFGSRARYRVQLKTPTGRAEQLAAALKNDFKANPVITVRSYRDAEDRVSESYTQVENFLSLIGLVILVLGGIGISSVTRVFIQQKMKTIAILKCLGGRNARVLGTYFAQVLALGLIGSLVGLLLAEVIIRLIPGLLAGSIPAGVAIGLTLSAVIQGLGIGLLISLLFALLPLLEIRNIKPNLVLRSIDSPASGRRLDWVRITAGIFVFAGVVALASWQAGSLKVGGIFIAGLGATALVLNLVGTAVIFLLKRIRHIGSFPVRFGVNSLYRPGNQTKVILLAVGLGAFFIISVQLLKSSLLDEFDLNLSSNSADMYLIDIRLPERDDFLKTVKEELGSAPELVPTLRARITGINGKPVVLDQVDKQQNRGMVTRDYVVTYRDHMIANEVMSEGQFWNSPLTSGAEISIDELVRDELHLKIGDTLAFDLAGTRVTARVANVRKIDWKNVRLGFLIVFRPGALDSLPQQMLVSAIKAPAESVARSKFQRRLIEKFPAISVIDVRDIIEAAGKIITTVSKAVTFVGGFVFLSGLLILIGSIAMTKYHRLYESAVLKTLGARRGLIAIVTGIEYGIIGIVAGAIGSAAAIGLSWAICKYSLSIGWSFRPLTNLFGLLITALLVAVVGICSSWDVLVKKPLTILRLG